MKLFRTKRLQNHDFHKISRKYRWWDRFLSAFHVFRMVLKKRYDNFGEQLNTGGGFQQQNRVTILVARLDKSLESIFDATNDFHVGTSLRSESSPLGQRFWLDAFSLVRLDTKIQALNHNVESFRKNMRNHEAEPKCVGFSGIKID